MPVSLIGAERLELSSQAIPARSMASSSRARSTRALPTPIQTTSTVRSATPGSSAHPSSIRTWTPACILRHMYAGCRDKLDTTYSLHQIWFLSATVADKACYPAHWLTCVNCVLVYTVPRVWNATVITGSACHTSIFEELTDLLQRSRSYASLHETCVAVLFHRH
jgi:hypothetical protein